MFLIAFKRTSPPDIKYAIRKNINLKFSEVFINTAIKNIAIDSPILIICSLPLIECSWW